MDFGKAITYPFEDDEWLSKLGLGLVVGLIPIVNFALYGWQVRLIQNVKANETKPLPAWQDFGGYFSKGLLVGIAWLIYSIPGIIMACVGYAAQFGGLAAASQGDGGEAMATVGVIVLACCGCLALLYFVAAGFTFAGGYVRFVDNQTFSTFMEFGTNFGLVRENLSLFLMAALYVFAAGFALSLVSGITFGLGGLVTPIVLTYFSGHILGQLSQQLGMAGAKMAPAV